MLMYYLVLVLLVPFLSAKVVDYMKIENGSYKEMATEQIVSTSLFFAAIPLLWDHIDSSSAILLSGGTLGESLRKKKKIDDKKED